MIKLWLVLRVLNEITTSIGPLTMDMTHCEAWAAREKAAVQIDADTGVKPDDVKFACEYSIEPPGTPEHYRAKSLPGSCAAAVLGRVQGSVHKERPRRS